VIPSRSSRRGSPLFPHFPPISEVLGPGQVKTLPGMSSPISPLCIIGFSVPLPLSSVLDAARQALSLQIQRSLLLMKLRYITTDGIIRTLPH